MPQWWTLITIASRHGHGERNCEIPPMHLCSPVQIQLELFSCAEFSPWVIDVSPDRGLTRSTHGLQRCPVHECRQSIVPDDLFLFLFSFLPQRNGSRRSSSLVGWIVLSVDGLFVCHTLYGWDDCRPLGISLSLSIIYGCVRLALTILLA